MSGFPVDGIVREILSERLRQITVEGWSPEHDDTHVKGELARAAGVYALMAGESDGNRDYYPAQKNAPIQWPWATEWWKPSTRRRDLIKAAALIVAEIERLDRAAEK